MSKTEQTNSGKSEKATAVKPTKAGLKSAAEKTDKSVKRKTPQKNAFAKMAELHARMPPFAERIVGLPFAADIQDDKIDFMNRAVITLRVEKQFGEQVLKMLDDFARENPQAKLRAGTFNV